MIKISSLDFLNIDLADVDILNRKGEVILAKGSPITQQWILKYYFRDIFVEEIYAGEVQPVETQKAEAKAE